MAYCSAYCRISASCSKALSDGILPSSKSLQLQQLVSTLAASLPVHIHIGLLIVQCATLGPHNNNIASALLDLCYSRSMHAKA